MHKRKVFRNILMSLIAACAMFMTSSETEAAQYVTVSIAAENTFSDSILLVGKFNLSISGTFAATVWVQRSFDAGVTWRDVQSFSGPVELTADEPEKSILYRLGVKTGGYTSGTVVGRLSK
jgi:hypothetical protein